MEKLFGAESLKLIFQSTYRDFFSVNDLVVSGNFSFRLGISGIGHSSSQIRIKQKIPAKCYVGMSKRKDNKINFGNIYFYDIVNNCFEKIEFSKVNQEYEKLCLFIRTFLDDHGYEGGIDFSILSETTRGHGFSFSGTTGALISTILHIVCGLIKKDIFDDYDKFLSSDIFKDIFLLGWQIEYISKFSDATGDGVMNTLINSAVPLYFMTQSMTNDIDVNDLGKYHYEYGILTDKFDSILSESEVPVDFAVIYSGVPSETYKIEKYKKTDIRKFNEYENFLKKDVLGDLPDSKSFYVSKFSETNSIYNNLGDNASIFSIIMLNSLKNLYENGHDNKGVDELINTVNLSRNVSNLVEGESDFVRYFNYLFDKNKLIFTQKIGICPIQSSKLGGGFLVVMRHGECRNILKDLLEEMRNVYPNVKLEYASYVDGINNDGIKIEQFVTDDVYSNYVQKDQCMYKDNHGKKYIGSMKSIIEDEKRGLLLDFINRKIYLDGNKLSSKDIHSQNTTIEILDILLDNIGQDIENSEFPISSYTKNKNEMISKIVIPLIKFCEDSFGEKLPLICKGGLGEFYMRLNDTNIRIGIIKKLG